MKLVSSSTAQTFAVAGAFLLSLLQPGIAMTNAEAANPETSAAKQQPPAALPPRPLQIPKPTIYKMANGLTVVLMEDHRVPFVTFEIGIRGGNTQDPKDMPGLAAVTADMLTEGTGKRTSKEIATEVDTIGGALHGSADSDFTLVSGSVLSKNQNKFFDLVSDVLLHPGFPEDQLKLEKTNELQELSMKRSNPGFLAEERFHKTIFGDHPYAVISPTAESVQKLTRETLQKFHKENYLPDVSSLVIVGDFQTAAMKQLLDKDLGQWHSGNLPEPSMSAAPAIAGKTICLVDRPGSVQSSVRIGNVGISRKDADFFPLLLANQILGGSANSRLFLNIREQKGYTYGAYSSFQARLQPGPFTASADVRTPVTGPALKEFLYELGRIRQGTVSDAEIRNAKNFLIGSFQSGFETQSNIAQKLIETQIYGLPGDYLSTYTDKIAAVTPEQIRDAADKHMGFDNVAITIVGDAKQIENDLRAFAPVEVYDQNGKLLRNDPQTAASKS